jgi:hypothetical protein
MSCCGQKRQALRLRPQSHEALGPAEEAPVLPDPPPTDAIPSGICFEYTGATAMTVIGAVTGRQYRFGWPTARLLVDPRDGRSLAAVPNLRVVSGSDRPTLEFSQ